MHAIYEQYFFNINNKNKKKCFIKYENIIVIYMIHSFYMITYKCNIYYL